MINVGESIVTLEARMKVVEDTLSKILSRLAALDSLTEPAASTEPVVLPSSEVKDGNYVYRALDASKNEIRLLAVYGNDEAPGEEQDVICELVHVSLDLAGVTGEVVEGQRNLEAAALKKFHTLSYTVCFSLKCRFRNLRLTVRHSVGQLRQERISDHRRPPFPSHRQSAVCVTNITKFQRAPIKALERRDTLFLVD
jgi:hypothetical protein